MDKSLINSRFREVVNLLLSRNLIKNKRELAEKLSISSTKLSEILAERMNVSAEIIGKMFALYPEIPFEYYLTENNIMGNWQQADSSDYQTHPTILNCQTTPTTKKQPINSQLSIPLLPISAVAGWNGIDSFGVNENECEQICIPYLIKAGAEFLIRVSGNSMQPNYYNGDLIGCRKVRDMAFFQWGKVYLLDSEQGAMLKRIFPTSDSDSIECRSDNPDYPPFTLPKTEIRSLSIVVGLVRTE